MPGKSTDRIRDELRRFGHARHQLQAVDSGPAPLTLDTFKNALVQHNVACNATNMRAIGKET